MAPISPKIFQTCLTLIALVHLRAHSIYGYSLNAFLGQSALQQQQITGVIRSKAEGPIQNQLYYNNADIVKSTYASNPASINIEQPQSNVYQKNPYFNFQPTPFHNHQDGFKYNGVYYTSSGNNNANNVYSNNNNALLANQQIANAPIVAGFNNAVVSNQVYNSVDANNQGLQSGLHNHHIANSDPNLKFQNFNNQNLIQQQLHNNNNAFNSQNQFHNNPFVYNQLENNPYAQNYHFHTSNIPQNQGVVQNSGIYKSQIPNQRTIQHSGIPNPGVVQNPEFYTNQVNNQGSAQLNNPGIDPEQLNNPRIGPGQANNQRIFQNQINTGNGIQNQAKTFPVLKYNIPSPHFQQNGIDTQRVHPQNSIGSISQPPTTFGNEFPPSIPQISPPNQFFQHPIYEPVHNNSIVQHVPEMPRIKGAILGQTRETPQPNNVEPLQTLSSQEISDAEFYAKQEPPRFPPLIDQGDIDNEEFRRRNQLSGRSSQRPQVRLQSLVQPPDVPLSCAYNSERTGINGDNCIEIK